MMMFLMNIYETSDLMYKVSFDKDWKSRPQPKQRDGQPSKLLQALVHKVKK